MEHVTCPICKSQHASDVLCIWHLSDRVKELESKLGAASVIGSKAQASEATARREEAGAAPSVSAVVWRGRAMAYRDDGYKSAADACDRAAAVTEWYERGGVQNIAAAELMNLCIAFVCGEPLPQKGG